MIGNRTVSIYRASEDGSRDAEGRRVASEPALIAMVPAHLFDRTMTYASDDGQLITVYDAKLLVPPGTDVRTQDLVEAAGVTYRVETVAVRYGPTGAAHHVSALCVRDDRG